MPISYTPQTWHDLPATDTPISAARLTHIENGILAVTNAVATLQSAGYQPLNSNLTAISALATVPFGRSLLTMADGPTVIAGIGANTTFVHLTGDETIAGIKTFTSPVVGVDPTTAAQLATKNYVDTHASSGDVSSTSPAVNPGGNYWDWVSNGPLADSATTVPTEHSVYQGIQGIPIIVTNDMTQFPVTTAGGVTMIDLTNAAGSGSVSDGTFLLYAAADNNEFAKFDLSAFANINATRTFALPDIGATTDTFALLNATQTLVGKTLTAASLTSPVISGTSAKVTTSLLLGSGAPTYTTSLGGFLTSTAIATYNLGGTAGAPYPLAWTTAITLSSAISAYVTGNSLAGQHGILFSAALTNNTSVTAGFNWASGGANGAVGRWFADESTYTADTITGQGLGSWISFLSAPTVNVVNAGTFTDGSLIGFRFAPTIGASVTLNNTSSIVGLSLSLTSMAGSVTMHRPILLNAPTLSGSGAITTYIGIDIAACTVAGTNVGIRNNMDLRQVNPAVFGADAAARTGLGLDFQGAVANKGGFGYPPHVTLTYASVMSLDVTTGVVFKFTTSSVGNATVNATSGGVSGQVIKVIIVNDASAIRTITWGTNFRTPGTTSPTATSRVAVCTFISDGTSWFLDGQVLGNI